MSVFMKYSVVCFVCQHLWHESRPRRYSGHRTSLDAVWCFVVLHAAHCWHLIRWLLSAQLLITMAAKLDWAQFRVASRAGGGVAADDTGGEATLDGISRRLIRAGCRKVILLLLLVWRSLQAAVLLRSWKFTARWRLWARPCKISP